MPIRRSSTEVYIDHSQFTGINNVDDSVVIGPRALRACTDYDNRKDGILVPRPGQTAITSQAAHSIWSNKDKTICLYRTGANIVQLNADESSTVIASGFSGPRMTFRDGEAGRVYLTDGNTIGMIESGSYTNLNSLAPIDHFKNSAMPGISIEYWNGILFIIIGDKVFYSDPFTPFQFDIVENVLLFDGPVTLFRGMANGIFVADGKIHFMAGTDPGEMPIRDRADYNAIPGSDVVFSASSMNEALGGMMLWFMSERGVCMGGDEGSFRNLTEKKYKGSYGTQGASLFRHDSGINRFIYVGEN
jgi:hypothetical protein